MGQKFMPYIMELPTKKVTRFTTILATNGIILHGNNASFLSIRSYGIQKRSCPYQNPTIGHVREDPGAVSELNESVIFSTIPVDEDSEGTNRYFVVC